MTDKENKRRSPMLRVAAFLLAIVLLVGPVMVGLLFSKTIKLNHPGGLKGADISEYQGDIEWDKLSDNMDFIFIKATEGSEHTDPRFAENLAGSKTTSLAVGAYHFFSYDSSGATQAEHFIDIAGDMDGMLPPVIDVEFYGDYEKSPKSISEVEPELRAMIDALEAEYGTKPIIYCTSKAYNLYSSCFDDCPLWFRNVYYYPFGKDWVFWQYSDSEELDGYHGDEKYIDMNTFEGTKDELKTMLIKR